METIINGRKVTFAKSGDKNYPVHLFIDGLFIGAYERFDDAEGRAQEICKKYPPEEP
jgi:hypothetical protein